MRHWDVRELGLEPHHPQILSSSAETRAVALRLSAGESLQEHQVHERSWVVILDGAVKVSTPEGREVPAGPGHVFEFEPNERHELEAGEDSRLLLLLTPWPGDGHPGAMAIEGKRESARAAEGA